MFPFLGFLFFISPFARSVTEATLREKPADLARLLKVLRTLHNEPTLRTF